MGPRGGPGSWVPPMLGPGRNFGRGAPFMPGGLGAQGSPGALGLAGSGKVAAPRLRPSDLLGVLVVVASPELVAGVEGCRGTWCQERPVVATIGQGLDVGPGSVEAVVAGGAPVPAASGVEPRYWSRRPRRRRRGRRAWGGTWSKGRSRCRPSRGGPALILGLPRWGRLGGRGRVL